MLASLTECITPMNTFFGPERFTVPVLAWAELPPCIRDKGCKLSTCDRILAHSEDVPYRCDFLWIFIAASAVSAIGLPIVNLPAGIIFISGQ
jgi:hypothetical protein